MEKNLFVVEIVVSFDHTTIYFKNKLSLWKKLLPTGVGGWKNTWRKDIGFYVKKQRRKSI